VEALKRSWDVLLIGGASGIGKTTLAHQLGRRFGVNVTQLDDIQAALEAATTPDQQPLLHFWRTHWDEFSAYSDDQHVQHFLDVSRTVFEPIIEAVIAHRLEGELPAIIEGDFILPDLAVKAEFGGVGRARRVRALFLDEASEEAIGANFLDRQGGDATLPAHTSWLKSRWLHTECVRLGVPTVAARPWGTTADRAVAILTETTVGGYRRST
jgi:2-phosphoglycerate kinase